MATVTGFTAERMLEIENSTVVDGEVQGDNLILLTRDGTPIDAGNVRGPQGAQGAPGVAHVIQDEGVGRAQQPALNFVGGGVTVSNDAANLRTVVNVPFSQPGHVINGNAMDYPQRSKLAFVGNGLQVSDDAVNDLTKVIVPSPILVFDQTYDTYESGDIGGTWNNLWGYGFPVVAGRIYEVTWIGGVTTKTAFTSGQYAAASIRFNWDGPAEAEVQHNSRDVQVPAPSVVTYFDLTTFIKPTSTGQGQVNIQIARAWWSTVNIRITRTPVSPQLVVVKDLGAIA